MPPFTVRRRSPARLAALLLASLLWTCLAAACGTTVATPVPVSLTVAAASGAQPLASLLADAYMQANPHVQIAVEPVASDAAAQHYVEQGRADAALLLSTAPLDASQGLTITQIAVDALVIAVHRDNPLQNIGLDLARQVFNGRVRLWSELDAGHGQIEVLTREDGVGERTAFQQTVMRRRQITPTALVLPGDRELLEALASEPEAIGYLPASWLDDRVKALTLEGMSHDWVALNVPGYPLTLPIALATPAEPAPEVEALRQFALSKAGGELLAGRFGLPRESAP